MDRFTLPTNWESFSDTILTARLEEIASLAAALDIDAPGSEEDGTPSGLEVAESLAEAKELIEAKLAERAEENASAAERKAAALAALAPADPEPEAEPDPEPAPEPEADDTAELTADPEPEPTPEPEPESDPATAEEPAQAPDGEAAPTSPANDGLAAAPAPQRDAAQALAAMNSRRTASELPQASSEVRNGRMRGVGSQGPDGYVAGQFFDDIDQLAQSLTDQIMRNGRGDWSGPRTEIPLMTSSLEFSEEQMLTASDVERNFQVMTNAANQWKNEEETLVAAGGICVPQMPTYDFTNCYTPQRPIEAGTPEVGTPRGGLRFLNQVPLGGEAAAAVSSRDAAQSALLPGDAGYVAKNCTRVSCPTETEVTVASFSKCMIFDNLNFRVFPEQIRDMLQRVEIEFSKAKEIFYLNRMMQFAGAPVDIAAAQPNPFGSGRSLFRDLVTIGHNYRKRNNMDVNAILDVWLPTATESNLAVDMVNDPDMSAVGSIVGGPNGNLTQVLAQRGRLNVQFYYYDSDEASFVGSAHDQAAGAWNSLPSRITSLVHAPGAVQRLNGGNMNLGVVRDSVLNGSNDLQIFEESWIEMANPGCEVNAFVHELCYSGVGPLGVAAPACP